MPGVIRNELCGQRFGSLFVVSRATDTGGGKKPVVKWECLCDCGKKVAVKSDCLLSGHTKSCGCQKIKHGYSNKERLYDTWKNMRRRCTNPKNKRWAQYGGRGIMVCPEWNEYSNFRSWAMSNGYRDDLTIDRIDVNGNYCPSNCRWADDKTQANNNSRNRFFNHNGEKVTMSQLADRLGVSYSALQHHIDRGKPINGVTALL